MILIDSIHGSLDDTSELDSNLYDIISFNAMDKVRIDGVVNKVLINYFTESQNEDYKITLFVIMATTITSSPNSFKVIRNYVLEKPGVRVEVAQKSGRNIRKFNTNIPIKKGQYLAVRFSTGAGNPHSTERNQYYVHFDDLPYRGQTFLFTNCPTKGIAMSFNVQTAAGMRCHLFSKL